MKLDQILGRGHAEHEPEAVQLVMSCGGAMHRKCIWRIMCIDSLPEWSKGVATSASCAGSNPTAVIFPRSLISNATTLMPNSFNAGQCVLPDSQPTRGVELGHHVGRRPHSNAEAAPP